MKDCGESTGGEKIVTRIAYFADFFHWGKGVIIV